MLLAHGFEFSCRLFGGCAQVHPGAVSGLVEQAAMRRGVKWCSDRARNCLNLPPF